LEGSNIADNNTKHPNIVLATKFLVSGSVFKQYMANIMAFLRLEVGPSTLQEQVKGDIKEVTRFLQ
jgi:hypothetical protein